MKNLTYLTVLFLFVFQSNGLAQDQNSLHFDGVDDYVETIYQGIDGNDPRTIEAWIKVNNRAGIKQRVVSWGGNGGFSSQAFQLQVDPSGVISVSQGIIANILLGSTNVADSQWHHVAVTYDAMLVQKVRLYVDGQLDTTYTNFAATVNTSSLNPVKLGVSSRPVSPNTNQFFSGNIDEVRIWDHARTSVQIDSFYDQEICPNHSGLVAYYRFNHGVADSTNTGSTRLYDHSTNGIHGTLNNFGLMDTSSNWRVGVQITQAPDSDTAFTVDACDLYISPGGRSITTSQLIVDTITNSSGCDSVLTIDVTVNRGSFTPYSVSACDSFVSYSGLHTWKKSGIYEEVFTNQVGCDSTFRYQVTIQHSSYNEVEHDGCVTYTSPSGKYTWTQSGTYMDTMYTSLGCDSILEIDLTMHGIDSTSGNLSACDSYTTPDGRVITNSGIYETIHTNRYGCDSVVSLDLTILESSFTSLTGAACDYFVSESGQNTWDRTGTYFEIQTAANGCDSTIRYDVTIHSKTSTSLSISACKSYTSPTGKVFTSSGSYRDTLQTVHGCDSILKITLSLTVISAEVTEDQGQLKASPTGKKYQWLDCEDQFKPIEFADGYIFNPASSGSYAVEVTQSGCRDTSSCYEYQHASVEELEMDLIQIYPNPSTGVVHVEAVLPGTLTIRDMHGKLIEQREVLSPGTTTLQLHQLSGIYFLQFTSRDGLVSRARLVKL